MSGDGKRRLTPPEFSQGMSRYRGPEPAVGLRYQLCAIEKSLRLCGCGVGRVFAARRGLGRRSEHENRVAAGGAHKGADEPLSGAGLDASF